MPTLIMFNKPFQVLSQFTDERETVKRATLADYIPEPGVYAAGRLDFDSEGLLLLCDDGNLIHRLSHPRYKVPKTYRVQVEGTPRERDLEQLRRGLQLKDGFTRPAVVRSLNEPSDLWPRQPPIRARKAIPTTWIEITVSEGRNRQIRRMTAHIGFPTLRLIRWQIGKLILGTLANGAYKHIALSDVLDNGISTEGRRRHPKGTSTQPNNPFKRPDSRLHRNRSHRNRNRTT